MINKRLQDKLPRPLDRESLFNDMFNECHSFKDVGGPFAYMLPSTVLRECDPIAYRCEVCDYMDSIGAIEYDGEEYDRDEFTTAVNEAIDEIDSEIKDLEEERDDWEEEEMDGEWPNSAPLESLETERRELEDLI